MTQTDITRTLHVDEKTVHKAVVTTISKFPRLQKYIVNGKLFCNTQFNLEETIEIYKQLGRNDLEIIVLKENWKEVPETDVKKIMVDFVVFAGHKTLYGPFGASGYINVKNIQLTEMIVGGTGSDSLNLNMPDDKYARYEVGSPNIVAIAGLNKALDTIKQRTNSLAFSTSDKKTEVLCGAVHVDIKDGVLSSKEKFSRSCTKLLYAFLHLDHLDLLHIFQ